MAEKKTTRRAPAKAGAAPKKAVKAAARPAAPAAASAPRPAGPTARTCPLVLDGEVDAADFSQSDCLTCSEFDCRFCQAEAGSGALRSRLFAGGEDAEDDGESFGSDFGFKSEEGEGGEEEEEDPF